MSLPAQQQACQPVTKDEYCINTVDRKLENKPKECRQGHQNLKKNIYIFIYQNALILITAAITVSNKISICNTQIVILYKNNLRPRSSIGTATS
jgi:hypothetical protein